MRKGLLWAGVGVWLISHSTFVSAQAYQANATGLLGPTVAGGLGAVGTRPLPDYDPLGIELGAWTLRPTVRARANYDDNIYNLQHGTGDTHFQVIPSFDLKNGSGLYQLSVNGSATIDRFAQLKTENTNTYTFSGTGTAEVGANTTLTVTGGYSRNIEPRGTPGDTIIGGSPITYRLIQGQANADQSFGALHFSIQGSVAKYLYEDEHAGGVSTSESYRNLSIFSEVITASYAISRTIGVFSAATFSQQDYAHVLAINQNATSTSVVGGIQFAAGSLITGRIGGGFMHVNFDDPRYPDSSGPTYNVSLQWNPTELITATIVGTRSLERSPTENVGGIVDSDISLKIDYELLRELIITTSIEYDSEQYRGIGLTDRRVNGLLSAEYKLNRLIGVNASIGGRHQRSNSASGRKYDGFSIGGGLVVHI